MHNPDLDVSIRRHRGKVRVLVPVANQFESSLHRQKIPFERKGKALAFEVDPSHEGRVREICLDLYGTDGDAPAETVTVHVDVAALRGAYAMSLMCLGRIVLSREATKVPVTLGAKCTLVAGSFTARDETKVGPVIGPCSPGTILEMRDVPRVLVEREIKMLEEGTLRIVEHGAIVTTNSETPSSNHVNAAPELEPAPVSQALLQVLLNSRRVNAMTTTDEELLVERYSLELLEWAVATKKKLAPLRAELARIDADLARLDTERTRIDVESAGLRDARMRIEAQIQGKEPEVSAAAVDDGAVAPTPPPDAAAEAVAEAGLPAPTLGTGAKQANDVEQLTEPGPAPTRKRTAAAKAAPPEKRGRPARVKVAKAGGRTTTATPTKKRGRSPAPARKVASAGRKKNASSTSSEKPKSGMEYILEYLKNGPAKKRQILAGIIELGWTTSSKHPDHVIGPYLNKLLHQGKIKLASNGFYSLRAK